jgi:hypothetical protein
MLRRLSTVLSFLVLLGLGAEQRGGRADIGTVPVHAIPLACLQSLAWPASCPKATVRILFSMPRRDQFCQEVSNSEVDPMPLASAPHSRSRGQPDGVSLSPCVVDERSMAWRSADACTFESPGQSASCVTATGGGDIVLAA